MSTTQPSIIGPVSRPSASSSSRQALTSFTQRSQSATSFIIGNTTRRSPSVAARSSARICGLNSRLPRRRSCVSPAQGASSSARVSQVRSSTGTPSALFSSSRRRVVCTSSLWSYRIAVSVRTRPMPAAPRVWGTSLSLMLQVGIRRKAVPSFVRQGRAATGSGFWPCRRLNAILQSAWAICAPSGSTISVPLSASRIARWPTAMAAVPPPSCTTAGMPMLRAMMAAWLTVLSWSLARPSTMRRSRLNRSLGKKRSATRMLGRFRCRRRRGRPSRISTTRRQTSQTSTLRSRMYSSSTFFRRPAKICSARSTAAAPPAPAAI